MFESTMFSLSRLAAVLVALADHRDSWGRLQDNSDLRQLSATLLLTRSKSNAAAATPSFALRLALPPSPSICSYISSVEPLLSLTVATRAYLSSHLSVSSPIVSACPTPTPTPTPTHRKRKRKLMDTDFGENHNNITIPCPPLPALAIEAPSSCFMRKLPFELLNEIFSLTLPPVPSFKANDCPMLLTHVCSWWRECATEQSNLWDTIYLPSPVEGLSNGIVELCSLWLERSRSRPLSVDFHLASDYQPWKITGDHVFGVQRIVEMLAPHAPRITKLLRVFPCFLLDKLRLEDMINLDDLFICDIADDVNGRTHIMPQTLNVPDKLRCLSLRQTFFDVKAFTSLSQIAHLDLWQLQGQGQMSIGTSINLLRQLSWLESCTLDVSQGEFSREALSLELSMPNLSFLFISWDWLVDVGPILDILTTPKLKRLGLRGPPPTRRQWTHLRRFLKRCRPGLTQLSIKEIGFTDIQLLDCLRLIPTLMNLSLSHCSIDSAFVKALRFDPRVPLNNNMMPMLEFLSLEACDDFEVKDLVSMLNTRGRCREMSTRRLRGIRLSFCRRILEAHRVDIENCGVENVIIRVNRSARHTAR
ncbi:hypothetical protein EW145_g2535 [Phellinidium pouzarii]|uniref:F-box domain-containing protein n=1 Tax=Phellinidium pouzarii TaxID=167371 RepID=A0A4S4LAL4_9AGAM|nr:hypothetical protein EW145_g2535 [Phellinidium pouzarii]